MDVANECMADVANAQLMAMACTLKRKQYFQARTTAIALAEANKLKKLELQKLELYIKKRKKAALELASKAVDGEEVANVPNVPALPAVTFFVMIMDAAFPSATSKIKILHLTFQI